MPARTPKAPIEPVQKPLLSVPASIIIGSLLISISILISGGIIKLKGNTLFGGGGIPSASTQPGPSGNPIVAGVTAGDFPTLGNSSAKVLMVEFADYQCPFCEQFFQSTFPQIKKDYIDTGKVKFAYRDFPFLGHPDTDTAGDESTNASNAARCANAQGKFWEYHDYLFSHQGQEDSGAFSKDNLKKFASDLGLDTAKFNQCVDSDQFVTAAQNDASAARGYGVNSTPTLFVNGEMVVGAQPYSEFKAAIDRALAK